MKTIRLQMSAMAHGGEALARHEGKVVFVPYVLPGEEVLVELTEEKARYSRGRAVEVITPSVDRVAPRCPHFGTCGGCQWQHVSYERQIALREEVLRSQLTQIARLSDVPLRPTLEAADPWEYRNHVRLHLDEEGRLGFVGADKRSVEPISECHIMHPLLWEIFSTLEIDFPDLASVSLRVGTLTEERLLILETAGHEVPGVEVDLPVSCVLLLGDGTPVTYVGNNHVTEILAGKSIRVSSTSFFQVNTPQAEQLVLTVNGYVNPRGDEVLLDLYCGVGTFAIALSDRVAQVLGIDASGSAIADAMFNSQGLTNVGYLHGDVEELLPSIDEAVHSVVLDPPRQGLSSAALASLLALAPASIVYVSCDPATLSRDAGKMVQAGYELLEIQPVDMFPQTHHIEAVALFRLSPHQEE
jgi:23S rRNA (uracil1939-C5)-methyltransferase